MTENRLYAVILDYQGGTYITQVPAASHAVALPKWLSKINDADLAEWGITRDELARTIKSEKVVPLDGCLNVWCISGSASRGLALINIIAKEGSR